MRKKLFFVFILIMMLSGCGINNAATISSVQSTVDTAAAVATSQSASASTPTLQSSVKGTKDGVDSFLSLYDYKSAYDGDECFNITPEQLRQSGYSVFKYSMSCASFLLYDGDVYPLGEWLGGDGVVSMAVCDLDGNGKPEFYFTFSWGSGIHRSQAGYFDPNTKQVNVFDYSYFDKDMLITGDANGLKLYEADFVAPSEFIDYTLKAGEYIADIVYDGSAVKLESADGAPVSTQQSSVEPSQSTSPVSKTELCKYAGGKLIKDSIITDDTGREIVKNAVFNYLIKDSAYPALDIGKLKDYIKIRCNLGEYYAFEKDGKYCMQSDERYSYLNDDFYKLLYDLASGYLNTNDMTVKSGNVTINAIGNAVLKDGFKLTPEKAAPYIKYIDLCGKIFGYIGKKQIFGVPYEPTDYKFIELDLFNTDFKQILSFPILSEISNADKSDFRSYLLDLANWPGKYIVGVSTFQEKNGTEQTNQYFFGLNLPEKPMIESK